MAQAYAAKYVDRDHDRGDMAGFILGNPCYEVVPDRAFGIVETEDDFSRSATKWVWD